MTPILNAGHATLASRHSRHPMPSEVERKFLVANDSWRDGSPVGVRIAQGYLSLDPDRTVRVRLAGDEAWLTIKGRTSGITRSEFEYAIPFEEALELLSLCLSTVIDKTRHRIHHAGYLWEIDVFHGANQGLVLAEVELPDETTTPPIPEWAGQEVSDDPRYYNANLASHPFSAF